MKSYSKYSEKNKRLEIHWSMLNGHCACRKATLYFSPAIAAKVESLVTNIITDVLICFPIIAQHSKGTHYFHRVVANITCQDRNRAFAGIWSGNQAIRPKSFRQYWHKFNGLKGGLILIKIAML